MNKEELEQIIEEKEEIVDILNNYQSLIKKYVIKGLCVSCGCMFILGGAIYLLNNFLKMNLPGLLAFETSILVLSVLEGVNIATDNEYYKIKKEYNIDKLEEDIDKLKEELIKYQTNEKENCIEDEIMSNNIIDIEIEKENKNVKKLVRAK